MPGLVDTTRKLLEWKSAFWTVYLLFVEWRSVKRSFQPGGFEVAFRHNIATFHVTIFGTPKRAEREMLQGVLLDCAMERSWILSSVPSSNVQNVKLP